MESIATMDISSFLASVLREFRAAKASRSVPARSKASAWRDLKEPEPSTRTTTFRLDSGNAAARAGIAQSMEQAANRVMRAMRMAFMGFSLLFGLV
jgi:hypothetical protein